MAITLVGTATGTNTATPPAHQAGDVFLVFAFRDGSATPPTLASSFGNINNGGANLCAHRLGQKVAASSSETVGTWSNATSLLLIVLRGVDQTTPIGVASLSGGASTTITYPSLAPQRTDGTSWVFSFGGHRSADVAIETVPSGMTLAISVSDATDEAAAFYLAGVTGTFTSRTAAVGGTSSGWRSASVEVRAALATGTLSLTDASDTASANGRVSISGQAGIVDGGDAVASMAVASILAAADVVDDGDVVTAVGTTVIYSTGAAFLLDEPDGIAAFGRVAATASAALADDNDAISAVAQGQVRGAASLGDQIDTLAAAGRGAVRAIGVLTDGNDAVSGGGRVEAGASAVISDGADLVSSAAQSIVSGAAALFDGGDKIEAAGVIARQSGRVRLTARAPVARRSVARPAEEQHQPVRPVVLRVKARPGDQTRILAIAPGLLRLVARDSE